MRVAAFFHFVCRTSPLFVVALFLICSLFFLIFSRSSRFVVLSRYRLILTLSYPVLQAALQMEKEDVPLLSRPTTLYVTHTLHCTAG
jgi:hypothetical protein